MVTNREMDTFKTVGKHPCTYIIEQGGLRIQSFSNRKLPSESFISFENIKRDRLFHTEKPSLFLVISGVFLMIFALTVSSSGPKDKVAFFLVLSSWGFLALLSIGCYFVYQQRIYYVKTFTGKYIKFKVKKNEEHIDRFVKELIRKRDEYLKMKYGTPNAYMSFDAQFSNFNIMHKEQIISTEELQEKLELLNNIFQQTVPKNTFLGYSEN